MAATFMAVMAPEARVMAVRVKLAHQASAREKHCVLVFNFNGLLKRPRQLDLAPRPESEPSGQIDTIADTVEKAQHDVPATPLPDSGPVRVLILLCRLLALDLVWLGAGF